MRIQYKLDGMFTNNGIVNYKNAFSQQIIKATTQAMTKVGKLTNEKIVKQAQQGLKIRRQAVLKSFRSKVYSRNKNYLPTLHYYSRVPWMGTHTHGATIGQSKKLIIPFALKRIGYKEFKHILSVLNSHKNIFMKKAGKTTIVYSKNTEQDKKILAPFRKSTRAYNQKIVRRNEVVVVGMMQSNIRLAKRFDMESTAINSVKDVAKEVTNIFKTSKTI